MFSFFYSRVDIQEKDECCSSSFIFSHVALSALLSHILAIFPLIIAIEAENRDRVDVAEAVGGMKP